MTGFYPEYTGERTYHVTDWRKRWPDVVTLNQHFSRHGYTTVGLGKIYHGSGGPGVDPDHWTRWLRVAGMEYADPESLTAKRSNQPDRNGNRRGPATEGADVGDDVHFDGGRAKAGAAQIGELAAAGKPFFLAVGFTKPHLPFVAPKKYWDLYQRDSFSLPSNGAFPPGYPTYARNVNAGELRSYSDVSMLRDPTSAHREFAYSTYPHGAGRDIGRVTGHSIRTNQYRYTEWWDQHDQVVDAVLTDIENDPGEVTAVEGHDTLRQSLSRQLRTRVLAVRK